MSEDNSRNVLFFEAPSMRDLYEKIDGWQAENRKRFLSLSIEQDGKGYCCIALTNPSEVVIVGGSGGRYAEVSNGNLNVKNY